MHKYGPSLTALHISNYCEPFQLHYSGSPASSSFTLKLKNNRVLAKISTVMLLSNLKNYPGGVLPQILDRGMPRRFLNPNPI